MALDVYVGTLTRYLMRDWENKAQRWAREHGKEHFIIGRPNEPPPSRDEAHELVVAWRDSCSQNLKEHLTEPLDWDESEEAPYFTERPGWEGLVALQLWAAYSEHPSIERPTQLPKTSDEDPAFKASMDSNFSSKYWIILHPELWLPCDFAPAFDGPTPYRSDAWTGSSVELVHELRYLIGNTFRADDATLSRWTEGGDALGEDLSDFESWARYALAMFLMLAEKSVANRLPMLLDY